MKQNIRLTALLLALLLVLSGCGEKPNESEQWISRPNTAYGTFSDQGYYYTDQGVLYFLDTTTFQAAALCSKIGCKHKDEVITETCEGYIGASMLQAQPMFFQNGKLYYTSADYYGTHLYSRNADGTGLTHIATLGEEYAEDQKGLEIYEYVAANDMLYYTALITAAVTDESGGYTTIEYVSNVIRRVDLKTGKDEELISSEIETLFLQAVSSSAILYFSKPTLDTSAEDYREQAIAARTTVTVLNLDTGMEADLVEGPQLEFCAFLGIESGAFSVYSVFTDGSQAICTYDLTTGQQISSVPFLGYSDHNILNDSYTLAYDKETKTNIIYDRKANQALPGGIGSPRLTFYNADGKGFIVRQYFLVEGTLYDVDYSWLCYCSYDSLADGFQQEDLIQFCFIDSSYG